MHEPNLVTPVATAPPEAMLKAGESAVFVKATVVALVVPNDGTPDGKAKGVFTTAAVVLAATGAAMLVVDVTEEKPPEPEPLSPPPQAAREAVNTAASMNLEIFNIVGIFLKWW